MPRQRRSGGPRKPAPPARPAPAHSGVPWLYGRHAVAAALANPERRCRRLVCLRDAAEELSALLATSRAAARPGAPEILDRATLEALLPRGAVHQGMALAADELRAAELGALLASLPAENAPHILLLLDQVSDPQNVGAILRSAAAFAAVAVIVPEHGAPAVTGALAKAASGAIEAVPLIRVTNLARCLDELKEMGFWSVGLDSAAPESLAALDLPARVALVLGGEGVGLRRLVRERCDFLAHLPTRGALTSLNVSNAAAVALYALTQRSR